MTREGRTENRKRSKNGLKDKNPLDPGHESHHIFYSGEVGAPEMPAPLSVAGHTALPVTEGVRDEHRRDMPTRGSDMPTPWRRAPTVGICRPKCRQAGRVGKCRHSRSAFAGRECRPGSDLSTRCLPQRRERAPGPAGRQAPCPVRTFGAGCAPMGGNDARRGGRPLPLLSFPAVMPGLVPGIHVLRIAVQAGHGRGGGGTWMPGTSPGMTIGRQRGPCWRRRGIPTGIARGADSGLRRPVSGWNRKGEKTS